jgi:hypothetical protein
MGEVSTIGLDIAKSVFQIHGVDADGTVVIRKRISRAKILEFFAALPSCLVGIEACPSAHHWSRKLQALGHTGKLMPPSYVKAYLKRSKNDANDAAAICEAVTRPSMRFVPTKSEQQQSGLMLHRSRQLLVRQRTIVGHDGTRRTLQGAEIALGSSIAKSRSRASMNWRGHDDVMQIRSIRGSGEPAWVIALPSAGKRLGPDPRRALGPAANRAASTGRTRDRTRPMLQKRQKVLAKGAVHT